MAGRGLSRRTAAAIAAAALGIAVAAIAFHLPGTGESPTPVPESGPPAPPEPGPDVRPHPRDRDSGHPPAASDTSTRTPGSEEPEALPLPGASSVAARFPFLGPPETDAGRAPLEEGREFLGRVVVKDGRERAPAAGVRLLLHLPPLREDRFGEPASPAVHLVTADDGTFRVLLPREGSAVLRIDPRDPRYAPPGHERRIRLDPSESEGADTRTIRVLRRGAIAGTVLDEGGAPVPDAWVSFVPDREHLLLTPESAVHAVRSDPRGRFLLSAVPGDAVVRVFAHRAGLRPAVSPSLRMTEGLEILGVELVLYRGAAMEGTVIDTRGAPVADVRVAVLPGGGPLPHEGPPWLSALLPPPVSSDGAGAFRVEGLPGDAPLRLYAWGDDVAGAPGHGTATPAEGGAIAPPLVVLRLEILRGRVVDETGAPVTSGRISLSPSIGTRGTADVDGKGRFEVRAGSGEVRVQFTGPFHMQELPVATTLPAPEEIVLSVVRGLEIAGRVCVDVPPGRSARITAWNLQGRAAASTRAEREGAFRLRVPDGGPWRLRVEAGEAFPPFVEVTAPRDDVELRAVPGGALRGRLVDGQGEPVPHLPVSALPAWLPWTPAHAPFAFGTTAGADGTFLLDRLPDDAYTLRVRGHNGTGPWKGDAENVRPGDPELRIVLRIEEGGGEE